MSSVCIIDTTIFLEILRVPGKSTCHVEIVAELRKKVEASETILLPMTTIIETGNHIAQNGDGRQRRAAASQFVKNVRNAIEGNAPFSPMNFLESDKLLKWIDAFPDEAMQEIGLGDFLIIREWEESKRKFKSRRVYIWSKDQHLQGCDSKP